jgi:hypothetical protein
MIIGGLTLPQLLFMPGSAEAVAKMDGHKGDLGRDVVWARNCAAIAIAVHIIGVVGTALSIQNTFREGAYSTAAAMGAAFGLLKGHELYETASLVSALF